MKTLNLANLNASGIKYKISKFPDGQQQVEISGCDLQGETEHFLFMRTNTSPVLIKSHLNTFQDLELIICAVASLRELEFSEIHLYVPYFIGARSDRKFEEGGNNYLKDVVCPIINSLNFNSVRVLDPHSDVLEASLKNFRKDSNEHLVKWALALLYQGWRSVQANPKCMFLSPDAGASKKIYKLAEELEFKGGIVTCSKDRDANGKLTKCVIPDIDKFSGSTTDVIIIDDICDGGNTFINMSAALNDADFKGKKYLIITHGIFSQGLVRLNQYFDGIYCTNSVKNIGEYVGNGQGISKSHVKQLNVF